MSAVFETIDKSSSKALFGIPEAQVHSWTVRDYYKMFEAGLFEGMQVELIGGQIIEMSAMGAEQATTVTLAAKALEKGFERIFFVRSQMSLNAGNDAEPQPDIAMVKGNVRDYKNAHPKTAALIVEVADSSLKFDRTVKGSIYARAGIKDYWIINIKDRRLEIYRKPQEDETQPFGFGYSEIKILTESDSIKPLAARKEIKVADLLP
ncbi:MAG: Uma2 family endonuclease [Acidobacteriota bacterium]